MPKRKFAVMTDSASDLTKELEEESGVDILPFDITVDGRNYTERVDFTPDEYYEMLHNCEVIPSTAHITTLRFLEQYKQYDDKGIEQVLYVSLNASGSNTYHAAKLAVETFHSQRPQSKMEIHIVDSHAYAIPYGWYVAQAAFKLQNGAEMKDVIAWLEDIYARIEIVLGAYSLRFLKKSGRVSAAAAFAGELLGVRPIITLIDGISNVVKKVRGDKEVIPAILEYASEHVTEGSEYAVAGTKDEYIDALAKACKERWGHEPLGKFRLGSAVATNTGPDAVGVYYLGKKRNRRAES
ncbi:DegV family protein [Ruminococcaceae bacterium OttesenSCG-928-I18]|nr:DegV family protein [Ruminococcaceae bacterium OttesenSCG-928-I18]